MILYGTIDRFWNDFFPHNIEPILPTLLTQRENKMIIYFELSWIVTAQNEHSINMYQ